ncbi:uncharacterized protein SCHCODRAFT_02298796 [Schizophyllum commune H4-8]|uniref:uncharacterized protein n=1 Tax=Schizophyllum commune (strain H4-8 / FGSC 9210) TaxID=578458 RepID=UPI00215EA10A|nr:uncharacterized protein SCHCODRAFT_02298796 [Schizophyllum commune H4-8]KAI5892690.1 hypothetical protein SCHCODRAFT_02298796 [Schizophyllum commune H4-8]
MYPPLSPNPRQRTRPSLSPPSSFPTPLSCSLSPLFPPLPWFLPYPYLHRAPLPSPRAPSTRFPLPASRLPSPFPCSPLSPALPFPLLSHGVSPIPSLTTPRAPIGRVVASTVRTCDPPDLVDARPAQPCGRAPRPSGARCASSSNAEGEYVSSDVRRGSAHRWTWSDRARRVWIDSTRRHALPSLPAQAPIQKRARRQKSTKPGRGCVSGEFPSPPPGRCTVSRPPRQRARPSLAQAMCPPPPKRCIPPPRATCPPSLPGDVSSPSQTILSPLLPFRALYPPPFPPRLRE